MTAVEDRPLRYIDSDGHILEPPTGMLEFAPAEYRDRIWHVETDADGTEWIVYNGIRRPRQAGWPARPGSPTRRWTGSAPARSATAETRPSGWTADAAAGRPRHGRDRAVRPVPHLDARPAEPDRRRVRPGAGPGVQRLVLRSPEGGPGPPVRRWRPSRRCTSADDVQGVADEIRHVADLPGMVSVFMRPNPAVDWRYFNDPVYDPIWAALQDTGLPVAFHPFLAPDLPGACDGLKLARMRNPDGTLRARSRTSEAARQRRRRHRRSPNIYFTQAIANPVDVMSAICYITSGGVAERFPGAKFMFLEANGGWLVPWLERLDHHARKFSWDVPWLKMLPSEYFRRQCWISFDPDESMLAFTANSPLCGADRIIWASDYPHPDAKFPGVTEELTEALDGLTYEQKRAITSESALALYGIR